nr:isoform 2 of pentatricopeptide repeat-containing protein [Quercus suber]
MTCTRMKPIMDQGTLVAAIKRCATVRDLETIQAYMIRTNFTQDSFLLSKLIESYAITLPIRQIAHAHKLFSWTHQPNLFMWNTIIRGYSINDSSSLKAIALYKDMHLSGISSNSFTFGFVLKACCNLPRLEEGKMVHSQVLKMGLDYETHVVNEMGFAVHQFVMGDELHPEIRQIYQMLDQMAKKLKQEGHVATTIDVLHDIDDEEKEHALGFHSERLAIAYGLLRLSKDSPIRIVKNLRVCTDCHSVMKLISSVYKRDIIVRDRIRFHHFREGKCSCNDYW